MRQNYVPAIFARGGTSKGLFFNAADLPAEQTERDALFLAALGSPDPYGRQLDGMGGGISSLSKIAILAPSGHPDADVDYTFGQVAVDQEVVDYAVNCGNLASAVGPVAVEAGIISVPDGTVSVRIHATNTRQFITSTFEVRDGSPVTTGDLALPGVAGLGAPIELEFHDGGGSITSGVLPSGNVCDRLTVEGLGEIEVSLVDATNPVVFVEAATVGMTGVESIAALDADHDLLRRLDVIRRAGGVAMGLGSSPESIALANPKIAVVGPAKPFTALDGAEVGADDYDISVRMLSMGGWHRAVTSTGALCIATAAAIEGTLPNQLHATSTTEGILRIGQPSGIVPAAATAETENGVWHARTASLFRTARVLMRGEVAVNR
ncbi:PrpF domain-containing protein [Arthrobacter sp. BE255]|uniref:2-methylaconitate cis-trans isomerase PrpF family protein n=1 Tax=Arthrobacter sp. BE255 TaxID=2817721 RepID=UPI0028546F51|nr:PrpF domain-containing protein [Arthrobacter sp. BE255]MDR7159058.1 2-methylaconitate cis-trans-isomerase PrpF [Arthrobacter sp. BE255]